MGLVNNSPVARWVASLILATVAVVFTWLGITQGPPAGMPQPLGWVALGLGWWLVLAFLAHALDSPRVHIKVENSLAHVTLRYPFKTVRRQYRAADVAELLTVRRRDSEGDPHYIARVTMLDGRVFELKEGSSLEACDQVLEQFRRELNIPPG